MKPRLLINMLFYSCNSLPLVNKKISEANIFMVDGNEGNKISHTQVKSDWNLIYDISTKYQNDQNIVYSKRSKHERLLRQVH